MINHYPTSRDIMARILGTVGELAQHWGLTDRLSNLAPLGDAYDVCMASKVEASTRSPTQAGAAYPRQHRIVLNGRLLFDGRETDRDATFLHECAHVVADVRHGVSCGHNNRWQRVMYLLGEPPEVCHTIEYLSRRAHAVAVWTCRNCGMEQHFVRRPRRRVSACYCIKCGPALGRLAASAVPPGRRV